MGKTRPAPGSVFSPCHDVSEMKGSLGIRNNRHNDVCPIANCVLFLLSIFDHVSFEILHGALL